MTDKFNIPDGYDEGTVDDAVVSNGDTKEVVVTDDEAEKAYGFELRELSWQETQSLVSENIEVVDGEPRLDAAGYARDALEEMIVDSTVDAPATFLRGMKQSIGAQLEEHVPDPLGADDELEAELGN